MLGISTSQFANLRAQFLRFGIDGLQPRPVGRPRRVPEEMREELDVLRQQVADLEHENRLLKVQAETSGLLRRQQAVRSKSGGAAASRSTSPRQDAAGGAVP